MKKTLLFFIFSISFFFLNAQDYSNKIFNSNLDIELISPNEATVEFNEDTILVDSIILGEERIIDIFLTNKGSETKNLYWRVETISFNDSWEFLICDSQNCYPPNYNHSSKNSPNVLDPDSTQFWSFHFYDNSVSDTGMLVLKMYDDKEFTNVIDTLPLIFKMRFNTSTNDLAEDKLFLSPNPASDYFNISSKADVSRVEIYNLIGKKVKTIRNTSSNQYDVSDLRNGIYLVRVFTSSNKILSVKRLNVTKSRP